MFGSLENEEFRKLLRHYPEKALRIFYQKWLRSLLALSYSFTNDWAVSQDIVQEAFVLLWEKRKEFPSHHEQSIERYIVRVVKFRSINYYKANLRIVDLQREYVKDNHGDRGMGIEAAIIKSEIKSKVRNLIAGLPRRERECVELKIDEGMTNAQIAAALNISIKAVERSVTSAYKRLRQRAPYIF